MMEVDDEDEGSDASKRMVLDEETTVKIGRSHAIANSNVFLVSFGLLKVNSSSLQWFKIYPRHFFGRYSLILWAAQTS